MKKITKAIIPAAGLGTRFLPFTKSMPKEMLPVVDTPAIEFIVREIVESGIKEILIITSGTKKAIEDHFDRCGILEAALKSSGKIELYNKVIDVAELADIFYIRQKQALGLADALSYGKSFVSGQPFAVLLGDDVVYSKDAPAIGQLAAVYEKTGKCVLGVQSVPDGDLYKYGVLNCKKAAGGLHDVIGVVEKPEKNPPSNLAVLGRYVLTADIFDAIENTAPRKNGEVFLTDAFDIIIKNGGMLGFEFSGVRYDLGDKLGYLRASVEYALRDKKLGADFRRYLKSVEL
jgi:UTP--glucose-1-phosphate uridylyltransferase